MLEEIIRRQTFIFLKLPSMFKELHASKEVKENTLESDGKSCRPGTKPQEINTHAMTSHCETSSIFKITFAQSNRTIQSIISPSTKSVWNQYFGKRLK